MLWCAFRTPRRPLSSPYPQGGAPDQEAILHAELSRMVPNISYFARLQATNIWLGESCPGEVNCQENLGRPHRARLWLPEAEPHRCWGTEACKYFGVDPHYAPRPQPLQIDHQIRTNETIRSVLWDRWSDRKYKGPLHERNILYYGQPTRRLPINNRGCCEWQGSRHQMRQTEEFFLDMFRN